MRQAASSGVVGKHGFDGSCEPGSTVEVHFGTVRTFSVGIFEYVLKKGGKEIKRSKAKVRVSGPYSKPELVYVKAKEIVEQLDAGTYKGPKNVRVKA